MSESAVTTANFPPKTGVLSLLGAGRNAFREVPGLRAFLVKGFLINYCVFGLIAAAVMGLGYVFVVEPLSQEIAAIGASEGFWAGLLHTLAVWAAWITGIVLMAATLLISVVLSLILMSLWFEALAGRIITHWRGDAAGPEFTMGYWLRGVGRSLIDGLWLLMLSVFVLVLGFVPVVGPLLVFVLSSYLLGREVRDPYLGLRRELDKDDIPRAWRMVWWTERLGMIPFVLTVVPVVGWLLLPMALIYLVAGVAWESERLRSEQA